MRILLKLIPILLGIALLTSLFFWQSFTPLISVTLLITSVGIAIFLTTQKHWLSYQQAECTREKMVHNMFFDLLGLLLTMGAAMYAGRLAGGYFGIRNGFWIGLLAGFAGGFLAAWTARSVWGRLVKAAAR